MIEGRKFRGKVESIEGRPALILGAAWIRDNPVALGQSLQVQIELEGPQSDEQPDDLRKAFAGNPAAAVFFDSLPTFYRNNYVRWLNDAKRHETRARRVVELMALLNAGNREK
jgi:hypothetical protein